MYKAMLSFFILIHLTFSSAYTKIYDYFLFFNEFEILEIRLEELYEHVDHFVLWEASETLSSDNPWFRKHFQWDQLIQGLENCSPNDIILLSNVGECISGDQVELLKEGLSIHSPIGFYHQLYRYFLNRKDPNNIPMGRPCSSLLSPQKIKNQVT